MRAPWQPDHEPLIGVHVNQLAGPLIEAEVMDDAGGFAPGRRQGELEAQPSQDIDEIRPGRAIDQEVDVAFAAFPALALAVTLPLAITHAPACQGRAEA